MNTPRPGERYAVTHPEVPDTLTVTVRHIYDGGSVRFSADVYIPHLLHLGNPTCQVAAACQWEALNPKRLTPCKGDVWLLQLGPSDRTEAEVLYVYPDGDICFEEPDGSETTCSPTFWESLNPSLVGYYVPLFHVLGKGFGKKLVAT
jgi:hypothetical protein